MDATDTGAIKEHLQDMRMETQEFLLELTRKLVNTPENIQIEMLVGEQTTVFKIHSAKEDMGQLLGKQGRTITALRQLIFAMMAKHGIRTVIEIECRTSSSHQAHTTCANIK